MKKLVSALFIIFLFFPIAAKAALQDGVRDVTLPDGAYESITAVTDYSFYEAAEQIAKGTYTADIKGVIQKTADMFFSEVKKNMRIMAAVIALAVICTFITNLNVISEKSAVSNASFISCYSVLAALTAAGFADASELSADAVENMGLFIKSLVPVLTGMAVAEGRIISAPAMQGQVLISASVAAHIIKRVLIPLAYATFAVRIVNNLTAEESLTNLAKFLDKLCKKIMSIMLFIFTGVLTLTNFASGTADSMGLKTVRFTLSSTVPVAGSALAETVTSLAASARMIKNSAGLAGIIAIVLMSAYPVIKCAAMSFIYNLAGALIQPVADKRFASAVGAVGECMGTLFALTTVATVMHVISAAVMLSFSGV